MKWTAKLKVCKPYCAISMQWVLLYKPSLSIIWLAVYYLWNSVAEVHLEKFCFQECVVIHNMCQKARIVLGIVKLYVARWKNWLDNKPVRVISAFLPLPKRIMAWISDSSDPSVLNLTLLSIDLFKHDFWTISAVLTWSPAFCNLSLEVLAFFFFLKMLLLPPSQ